MDLVGATILDWTYDHTYVRWRRRKRREKAARAKASREKATASRPNPHTDVLLEKAQKLSAATMPQGDRVYQWSRAWVQLKSPSAFAESERLQANSKFFRGFVVAAIVAAFLAPSYLKEHPTLGRNMCFAVGFVAFLRYCDLRWKAVHQVYRRAAAEEAELETFDDSEASEGLDTNESAEE